MARQHHCSCLCIILMYCALVLYVLYILLYMPGIYALSAVCCVLCAVCCAVCCVLCCVLCFLTPRTRSVALPLCGQWAMFSAVCCCVYTPICIVLRFAYVRCVVCAVCCELWCGACKEEWLGAYCTCWNFVRTVICNMCLQSLFLHFSFVTCKLEPLRFLTEYNHQKD